MIGYPGVQVARAAAEIRVTMADIPAPIAPAPELQHALPDLQSWTAHFLAGEIPVLTETAEALEVLRTDEDRVDANLLGELIATDPLMTLKVLAHIGTHRPPRLVSDVETVTAALVLLGISPFFRQFGTQATVEDRLSAHSQALAGLRSVLRRAHRASKFALAFAVHRMDGDAAVIHQAALLHDFAEMLLWCYMPTLALEIAQRQQADSTLRSIAVQRAVLHITLPELQQNLMRAWHLPELLIRITDDRHAASPQVRNVLLAIRVARHSGRGWDNAAIPDDVNDIAALLNMGPGPTLNLLQQVDL